MCMCMYIWRGVGTLQVITLLMALKVSYPSRVFLVRGNHETRDVNKVYGFFQECQSRIPNCTPEVAEQYVGPFTSSFFFISWFPLFFFFFLVVAYFLFLLLLFY